MNKQKLFEMFADLIYDYKRAEESLIWETSYNIKRAENKLEREVAERIENFKAELNSSEWIPCSERLPEEGAVVLVSLEEDEDWSWVRLVREGYYDEGYWFDTDGAHYGLEILAWMPLPEPYKESD